MDQIYRRNVNWSCWRDFVHSDQRSVHSCWQHSLALWDTPLKMNFSGNPALFALTY